MSVAEPQPAAPKPEPELRSYRITPDRAVIALLAVEVLLWLSDRFGWLPWHKGYAVLTAVATVGVVMLLMFLWFAIAWIFRWRFQCSIRALLLLTVVITIPSGWLAVEMRRATEQRQAVAAVDDAGGRAIYDYQLDESGNELGATRPPGPAWLHWWCDDDLLRNVAAVDFRMFSSLDAPNVTDATLGKIKSLSHLRWLHLTCIPIKDVDLECLEGMTQLDELDLSGTQITDAGLERLQRLIRLQQLDLACPRITDNGMKSLEGLFCLRRLNLRGTKITENGFRHLAGLPELRSLDLDYTGFDGTWIRSGRLVYLESLSLCRTQITDAGMEYLHALANLRELILSGTRITGVGLKHLQGLTQLQRLDCNNTKVTDDGLEHLKGLSELRFLYLSQTEVSDTGLEFLKGLGQLKELFIDYTHVTGAGVKKLQRALPDCKIEWKPPKHPLAEKDAS